MCLFYNGILLHKLLLQCLIIIRTTDDEELRSLRQRQPLISIGVVTLYHQYDTCYGKRRKVLLSHLIIVEFCCSKHSILYFIFCDDLYQLFRVQQISMYT